MKSGYEAVKRIGKRKRHHHMISWISFTSLLVIMTKLQYVQLEPVEREIFLQALIENSNINSFIKAEFSSRFGRVLVYVTTTIYNSSLRFFIVINITF